MRQITGRCHCGNIRFEFDWPGDAHAIPARACGCGFCVKHGGVYTSHPDSALRATVESPDDVHRYRFGTATADFHVCRRCGVVPFVTSRIEGRDYAVVNVNTFEAVPREDLRVAPSDFDGESTGERLSRRTRNWIGRVSIASGEG